MELGESIKRMFIVWGKFGGLSQYSMTITLIRSILHESTLPKKGLSFRISATKAQGNCYMFFLRNNGLRTDDDRCLFKAYSV